MTEDAFRAMLHSTEYLKTLLEAVIIRPAGTKDTQAWDEREGRILAVVAHKDDPGVSEEGSVFICTSVDSEDPARGLDIECAFPLSTDLSISVAQAKYSLPGVPNEKAKGFSLTINPGLGLDQEIEREPITLFTNDVKQLSHFLTECRALTHAEDDEDDEEEFTSSKDTYFQWLLPYTSDRVLPRLFGLIPQDLRLAAQPLHARLSHAYAGLPGDDVEDFKLIRNEWIRIQAREVSRKGDYKLKIRLGTFNVNGNLPSQDLSTWITSTTGTTSAGALIPPLKEISPLSLPDVESGGQFEFKTPTPTPPSQPYHPTSSAAPLVILDETDKSDPDLLVLGFQELDLSTEALVYSTGTAREDAWCHAVFAGLGEKGDSYEKLASKQLVGMLIVVIVKKSLASCFSNISTSSAAAGIMGVMGNKGGAAVRLAFTPPALDTADQASQGPTILTFVNSHLAAFDEMFEKRNLDFQDLSKRIKFNSGFRDTAGPSMVTAYDSDVLFWMVDLNYRVDLPDGEVRSILASDELEDRFPVLLKYDQLRKASRTGRAFTGFSEHLITHLPTYRFSPGLGTDLLGYDIKRKPAWTDRILYMAGKNIRLRQLSYSGHPQITMSDHRPVSADFVLGVDVYDKDLHRNACRKLCKTTARREDYSSKPMKLDRTSVDMGAISYKHRNVQRLSLKNNGKDPCAFRFVPATPHAAESHPPWLHIEPMQAIILPNESVQITLSSFVDDRVASKLNTSEKALETTLILHTLLGKDHFISVTAEYQYTCFANSLSRLARLPGPIRSLKSPDELRPEDQHINAPREIMRLVNWLMSDHVSPNGMFSACKDECVIETIRECLDTGDEFPYTPENAEPSMAMAFGETLLRLLDSLIDPVVPASLHSRCIEMTSRDEAFELLDSFPPVSVNIWISLTAFLHFYCHSPPGQSSSKAARIAMRFAPILLRDDPASGLPAVSLLGKQKFLLYFIT